MVCILPRLHPCFSVCFSLAELPRCFLPRQSDGRARRGPAAGGFQPAVQTRQTYSRKPFLSFISISTLPSHFGKQRERDPGGILLLETFTSNYGGSVFRPGCPPDQRQAGRWSLSSEAQERAEHGLEQSRQLNPRGLCCKVF